MATTGELRAIIEELQLIDVGDAASYLGEETPAVEEFLAANLPQENISCGQTGFYRGRTALSCEDSSFR